MNIIVVYMFLLYTNILSFNIKDIVRFTCKGCMTKANQCCIGTILSPRYIITTNYCAEMCQYIEKNKQMFKIKQYHIYPHAKTFAMGYNFIGTNTIALVEADFNEKSYSTSIKLLSTDISKLYGSSALIAILDGKTKFSVAEIKKCEQDLSDLEIYYICAGEKHFQDCHIRQGTPIILNDNLIGVMGIQDTNSCQYSERNFLAINSMIYWINYILDSASYNRRKSMLFTLHYRRKNSPQAKSNKNNNTDKQKKKISVLKTTIKSHNVSDSHKASNPKNSKNTIKKSITYKKRFSTQKKTQNIKVINNPKKYYKTTIKASIKRTTLKKKIIKKTFRPILKKTVTHIKIKRPEKEKHCTRPESVDSNLKKTTKIIKHTTKTQNNKSSIKKGSTKSRNMKIPSNKTNFNMTSKSTTSRIHFKLIQPKTISNKINTNSSKENNNNIYMKNITTTKKATKNNVTQNIKKGEMESQTKQKLAFKLTSNFTPIQVSKILRNPRNGEAKITTVSTFTAFNITKMRENTETTNAMDWFKNAFKKISKGPNSFLILTTAKVQTKFVDLT